MSIIRKSQNMSHVLEASSVALVGFVGAEMFGRLVACFLEPLEPLLRARKAFKNSDTGPGFRRWARFGIWVYGLAFGHPVTQLFVNFSDGTPEAQ